MVFFPRNNNPNNRNRDAMDSSRWALEEIKSSYVLKEMMGEGCFGTVRKVQSRRRITTKGVGVFFKPRSNYACKTIPRSKLDDMNLVKEECANLESVRGHPHLLEFEQTFEDTREVHIITELLEGGELYGAVMELMVQKSFFRDDDAAWMVRNILDGLSYCHDVTGIVHRDLKANNFMFQKKPNISISNKQGTSERLREIKIIDYGFSTTIDPDTGTVQGCVGTPYYVAPEVLKAASYDSKCDVWSIGVIAYLILSKTLPFQGKDEYETVRMLQDHDNHQPKYDSPRWKAVEPEAVSFCKWLLTTNPAERPTARDAMAHPWIVKHCGVPPQQRARINLVHSIVVVNNVNVDTKPEQPQPPQHEQQQQQRTAPIGSDSFDTVLCSKSSIDSSQDTHEPHNPSISSPNNGGGVLLESIPDLPSSLKQKRAEIRQNTGTKNALQRWWFASVGQQHRAKTTTNHLIRQKTQNTLVMNA